MVWDFYIKCKENPSDILSSTSLNCHDIINEFFVPIEIEYFWWRSSRSVTFKTVNEIEYTMFRYASPVTVHRPESYVTDDRVLEKLVGIEKATLAKHITSSAESGWDFSSRWLGTEFNEEDSHFAKLIFLETCRVRS